MRQWAVAYFDFNYDIALEIIEAESWRYAFDKMLKKLKPELETFESRDPFGIKPDDLTYDQAKEMCVDMGFNFAVKEIKI